MLLGASGASGYNLTRSLRFRASASANLSRTPPAAGDRTKWSVIFALKRGIIGSGSTQTVFCAATSSSERHMIRFNGDVIQHVLVRSGSTVFDVNTSAVFRDPSGFYLIKIDYDTSQAIASDRSKITVNGVLQTTSGTYPTLNYSAGYINSTLPHYIGVETANQYFDGYLAEYYFTDGINPATSATGSTNALTGVWQPARYTGTYGGTNGFYLPFTDNSALTTSSNVGLGKDFSGNGNYWTTNNISITAGVTYDSMTDVPTLTSATASNFAVMNPLYQPSGSGAVSFGNGNLLIGPVASSQRDNCGASMLMPSTGYWYAEFTGSGASSGNNNMIGIVGESDLGLMTSGNFVGITANSYGYLDQGNLRNNNTTSQTVSTMGTTPVVMVAFGNGKLWWGLNGTWLGTGSPNPSTATSPAYSGLTGNYGFAISTFNTSGGLAWHVNFGQRPFTYTPPTGFVALNAFNLPTATILKGNTQMDATLYTGTLLSNSITNAAGFQPDLVWVKSRSAATDHELTDSVRGVTKSLTSNSTAAEATDVQGLTAFNANGFTVGTNTNYNNLAATYVGWQWKANGAAVSNTAGSITSQVSANTSAGFSVVTYNGNATAGATVGHGLGVAPKFIIVKNRTTAQSWLVYHSSIGNTNYLVLNSTSASAASAGAWNNTSPTSTVFSLGNSAASNESGSAFVAYCWADIAGFSSIGSYTGNGDGTNAPFIYTGFAPKLIIAKASSGAASWIMWDATRSIYNVVGAELYSDLSNAETTGIDVDFLSNGFKFRNSTNTFNAVGSYVYIAFALNPFKNSLGR
jgi:hypothetical protein